MCNCLDIPCKVCGLKLPVHLGDYNTKPSEIECYCKGHLPKENVRVFTLINSVTGINGKWYRSGWKMGIRALTENARNNRTKNYPNLNISQSIEDRE
jgi:hypothetical protein